MSLDGVVRAPGGPEEDMEGARAQRLVGAEVGQAAAGSRWAPPGSAHVIGLCDPDGHDVWVVEAPSRN